MIILILLGLMILWVLYCFVIVVANTIIRNKYGEDKVRIVTWDICITVIIIFIMILIF